MSGKLVYDFSDVLDSSWVSDFTIASEIDDKISKYVKLDQTDSIKMTVDYLGLE